MNCNFVQVACQLLELVHQGFLIPVLGPALVQEVEPEALVAATAYLDLFLRWGTNTCSKRVSLLDKQCLLCSSRLHVFIFQSPQSEKNILL